MNQKERDIQRKLRILKHAEETGHAAKTCRYFGVARASFYRWKALYKQEGEAGLINKKPIPKNPIIGLVAAEIVHDNDVFVKGDSALVDHHRHPQECCWNN